MGCMPPSGLLVEWFFLSSIKRYPRRSGVNDCVFNITVKCSELIHSYSSNAAKYYLPSLGMMVFGNISQGL